MNATTRWRKALEHLEELQELDQQATPGPWEPFRRHDFLPTKHMLGVAAEASEWETLFEDPDLTVPDVELIVHARNMLPGLLVLTEAVLRHHEPFVDPDGEAMCHHCVRHGAQTLIWPCPLVNGALAVLEEESHA